MKLNNVPTPPSMNLLRIFILGLTLGLSYTVNAQSEVLGTWKTIDEESGKAKALVEIYKDADHLYQGRIIQLYRDAGEEQDPTCSKCEGRNTGAKVIGLKIVKNLVYDDQSWDDGTILDPETGKVYDCKIWLEGDQLKVRGYVAFFYRTQTWERY
jgi:uncharacterized protein (DUF2147 family)